MHYACVKSAVVRIKPDEASLYYEHEPSGPWWELTKPLLRTVQVTAPREIFGRPLAHAAHRADVVRLQQLIKHGGIYLDTDVLVNKDFAPLLQASSVLGTEGADGSGLCNAVILAEPDAPFLRRWLESYRSFRSEGQDAYWNEHSVKLPKQLAAEHPAEITVLGHKAFFWPLWTSDHLKWMFASADDLEAPDAYAHHLWESRAWIEYLENLTVADVRSNDTNFHRLVRPLIADLPDSFGRPAWQARAATRARQALLRARRLKSTVSRSLQAK
jgi:Glycosyltransferase sugar-binding region containing DXD motif